MRTEYRSGIAPYAWNVQENATLAEAVRTLFSSEASDLTTVQVTLIQQYLVYYIAAPGWNDLMEGETLPFLREQVKTIATVEQIRVPYSPWCALRTIGD